MKSKVEVEKSPGRVMMRDALNSITSLRDLISEL